MSIPLSSIVKITPRVISSQSNGLQVNGLFLTVNKLLSATKMVYSFVSAKAVGLFFGYDSVEYQAAVVYFNGYKNSFKKPAELIFALRLLEPIASWLRGATITRTLEELKSITSGSLALTIDNIAVSLTGINLSGATSLSDIADIIESKIIEVVEGTTVTYSSLTGAFQITSGTAGIKSSITFATGNIAEELNLTFISGAVLSVGKESMSASENLKLINETDANWVTFSTIYDITDEELIGLASWATEQGTEFAFIPHTLSATAVIDTSDADPASLIKKANLVATTPVYGDVNLAAFIMGTAGSIDYTRQNSVITFAFKQQDGLLPTVTDESVAYILNKKGYTYYGKYTSRNDEFIWSYEGKIFGDYGFLDAYINAVYLNNSIQLALANGLRNIGKLGYSEADYARLRGIMETPIDIAVNNGTITKGVELNSEQKALLEKEAGLDISDNISNYGYYLQIVDPGAAERSNRNSPLCSLWYVYDGAIHRLNVASTAVL